MRHASLRSNDEVGARGDDEIPEPMFRSVLPSSGCPKTIRQGAFASVRAVLCQDNPPLDSAGEASPRPAAPSLYSVRSERRLIEHPNYNLVFRWFVELAVDVPVGIPGSSPRSGNAR
jgi:hypothetical protein